MCKFCVVYHCSITGERCLRDEWAGWEQSDKTFLSFHLFLVYWKDANALWRLLSSSLTWEKFTKGERKVLLSELIKHVVCAFSITFFFYWFISKNMWWITSWLHTATSGFMRTPFYWFKWLRKHRTQTMMRLIDYPWHLLLVTLSVGIFPWAGKKFFFILSALSKW